jgi:hypothetical protein
MSVCTKPYKMVFHLPIVTVEVSGADLASTSFRSRNEASYSPWVMTPFSSKRRSVVSSTTGRPEVAGGGGGAASGWGTKYDGNDEGLVPT